jgi:hypothetical protein
MCTRLQKLTQYLFVFTAFGASWPTAARAESSGCESVTLSSCLMTWPGSQIDVPAGISIAPPINVKPADTGLAASTSLSTWRDYNASQLSKKVEQSLGPNGFAMVRPPQVSMPLDIWTRVQIAGVADDADRNVQIAAGADYKLSRSANLGLSTSFAGTPVTTGAAPAEAAQDIVGAYANISLLPAFSIEAKGQWVIAGDGAEKEGAASETSMSVAPRISQKFTLDGGNSIEPYVTLRNELYAEGAKDFTPSAGGGVIIDKPKGYSLSISTMVEGIEQADQPQVNSKIQLKVPMH